MGIPVLLVLGGMWAGPAPVVVIGDSLQFTLPENRLHLNVPDNRLEYTVPENRLHWNVPDNRLEYTVPENRLEYNVP